MPSAINDVWPTLRFGLKITIFFASYFLGINLVAQTITANKFSKEDGLSSTNIRYIHEDKYGYKWISTAHGLNMYDGYTFKIFRYDPLDSFSIRANSLGQLFEDQESNIWISIDIGGLSRFHRSSGRFEYFNYDSSNPSDANNFITNALFDSKGRGWVSSGVAINQIDFENKSFLPVEVEGHNDIRVISIFESSDGKIWLGAFEGLFVLDDGIFKEIKYQGKEISTASRFQQEKGFIYVNSFGNTLYQVSLSDLSIKPEDLSSKVLSAVNNIFSSEIGTLISVPSVGVFKLDAGHWQKLEIENLPADQLFYVQPSATGTHAFGLTFDNWVFLIDLETLHASEILKAESTINAFWIDEDGRTVWICGQGLGLYQITLKERNFGYVTDSERHRYSQTITAIAKTDDGNMYSASGPRMTKLVKSKANDLAVVIDEEIDFGLQVNSIYDKGSSLILATINGIYEYNKTSGKAYTIIPEGENQWYSDMDFDNSDRLWAVGNRGIIRHDFESDSTLYLNQYEGITDLLKKTQVRTVTVDSKDNIWIGTVREGLFRIREIDGELTFNQYIYTGVRNSGFQSQTVNAIFEDEKANLWIGGFSSGLLRFDTENEKWINTTPKGTMPIPNIQSIEQASDGSLWLSAIDGLYKYTPSKGTFKRFGTEDGLDDLSFQLQTSAKGPDGELYFGSTSGIVFFNPGLIKDENLSPGIQIEQVRLFDQPINREVPIQELKEIQFSYDQNFIGFDFISIDFSRSNKIIYSYQLQGVDEDWVNNGFSRSANYANLSPGRYTFKVRAGVNAGSWSEKITSLEIYIKAPFWQRWWFYVLMGILVAIILFTIHQMRLRRKLQRIHFMESVRKKAAADFHDEMGNKLTRIALFSEVLERKLNGSNPETSEYIEKIKNNSRSLNNSMRDFLWALDPKRDSAYDLATMLKDFGEELFDKTAMAFSVDQVPDSLHEITLTMDWKRHLVMTFKEAMHNVLKHSEAKNVFLHFAWEKETFRISLRDDGKGFDVKAASGGYGLRNMKIRIEELRGRLEIKSSKNNGTEIVFKGEPLLEQNIKSK